MVERIFNLNAALNRNSNKELSEFYDSSKEEFTAFLHKRYSLDPNICKDFYQESFRIFYEQIQAGKITYSDNLKAYLIGIGKKLALKDFERQKKLLTTDLSETFDRTEENESENWIIKQEITDQEVKKMDERCKQILQLFYWKKKSMKEIAKEMNLGSEQSAKNRKHLCFKKIAELLLKRFQKEGLL